MKITYNIQKMQIWLEYLKKDNFNFFDDSIFLCPDVHAFPFYIHSPEVDIL